MYRAVAAGPSRQVFNLMRIVEFSLFFRSPDGKVPVSAAVLARPLLLDADLRHPGLTMADYFASLQQFVLDYSDSLPLPVPHGDSATPLHCKISSEKLGAFYHVAKVEFQAGEKRSCLAVNTAISATGKQCLAADHLLLGDRLPAAMRCFVPEIFCYAGPENKKGPAAFHHLAVEWLENFHEWHLCSTGQSEPRFTLWTETGPRPLGERTARALVRRIAHILTLSYDWTSGSFLQRWHHAAGDFIARRDKHDIEVRLITVRAIAPFPFLDGHDIQVQFSSLLLFLIDLSIRMRLDKLDGVGKIVWLDDFVVEETIRGFFSALAEHHAAMGKAYETFIHLLPLFSTDELSRICTPLFPFYEELLSVSDFTEVTSNFANHIAYLATCLTKRRRGKKEHSALPGEPF